jgi:hypothetical protein
VVGQVKDTAGRKREKKKIKMDKGGEESLGRLRQEDGELEASVS